MILATKMQGFSGAAAALTTLMGFTIAWPYVVAGMIFCLAGGFVGMVWSPPTERRGVFVTLFVALMIGLFAGMAHPQLANGPGWLPDLSLLPVQLVMGLAGLASRPIASALSSGRLPFTSPDKGRA